MSTLELIMDRWFNDALFRAELSADPEGTVRRGGFELNEMEWAALRRWENGSLAHEALQPRITKMNRGY